MTLQTIDKPNLYFSAQLLINHMLAKIVDGHTVNNQVQYHLFELKQVFRDNIASTTTHLEAIAELAQNYRVFRNESSEDKGLALIKSFTINGETNTVSIALNPEATDMVKSRNFHIKAVD